MARLPLMVTAMILALLSPPATAEAPADVNGWPAPGTGCSGAEHRQLDFWLGTWQVSWDLPDGRRAEGRNTITRTHAGCVLTEAFEGGPDTNHFQGTSHSLFHVPTRQWRQTWVDTLGGYFDLTGGPAPEGRFILTNIRLTDSAPHLRMVWENISPAALDWLWQKSADGQTWETAWHIRYERVE